MGENKYSNNFILKTKALAIAVLVLFFVGMNPVYASPQDDLNQINKEIDAINSQLSTIGAQKKTLSTEVSALDAQINAVQLKINATQAEIDITNNEIAETEANITKAEADLKRQKEIMGEFLKTMYIEGQVSTVELIATSDSFSDFVDRSQYLDTMSQKVQETAQKIVELKKELDQKKNDLEVKKAKNEQLKAEQVAARQGIESQRAARDVLLQETKGQESNYQAKLKEAQQREATAWSAYMDSIRGASASDGSTYNGGGGTGYLSWPLRGYVSQGYGCTEYAMCGNPAGPYGGNIHNGLDIATFSGDPIHAAADGYVLDEGYAYNSGGWGNWIIIKHPNGLATLYAHQTSFAVTKNQAVKKGQVIGYEGNTGNSTGPHLHFSVFTSLTLYDTGSYHGPNYNGTTNPYNFL